MSERQTEFEGYGYRTGSRFGSWTKITVDDDVVSISGPRASLLLYRLWIGLQVFIELLVVPAVVAAVIFRDWRYLLLVPALLALHWFVSVTGAAGLWELANLMAIGSGHPTQTFTLDLVKRVKIGPGWARNGLWLVILPYVAGLNNVSEGHTLSFEAPAGDVAGDAVYAFHMHTEEDAAELARLLQGD